MNPKTLVFLLLAASMTGTALAQPGPTAMRRAFDVMDENRDGFITLDEFHKDVLHSWQALDVGKSGELTQASIESIPGHGQGIWRVVRRADANKDGKVTFKEIVERRMEFFSRCDLDGDERLSLSEVLAFQRKAALDRAERRAARAANK